jgi:membrane protein implicated in regulation of membrane protease activity
VAALAVVTGAWLAGPAGWPERALFAVAALALLVMAPISLGVGLVATLAGVGVHLVRHRRKAADNQSKANR